MRVVLKLNILRLLCLLTTCGIAGNANAETIVVPLLQSGDNTYMAAEFSRGSASTQDASFANSRKVSERFLEQVRKSDIQNSSLFSELDGSVEKWVGESVYKQYLGFSKIDDVEYKAPILWGSYVFIPTTYTVGERSFAWREDYLCRQAHECKKSIFDFGQLFEVSYRFWITDPSLSSRNTIEQVVEETQGRSIFDLGSTLTAGSEKPSFKVAFVLKEPSGSNCISCESPQDGNDFEAGLLSNVRDLAAQLDGIDLNDEASIDKLTRATGVDIDKKLGIPQVSWETGRPSLIHTDYLGYFSEWKRYASGAIKGYMLDQEYAYLFLQPEEDGESSPKEFQIVVLKKGANGKYILFPHTEKSLRSRSLMFSSDALALFSEVLGVVKTSRAR